MGPITGGCQTKTSSMERRPQVLKQNSKGFRRVSYDLVLVTPIFTCMVSIVLNVVRGFCFLGLVRKCTHTDI